MFESAERFIAQIQAFALTPVVLMSTHVKAFKDLQLNLNSSNTMAHLPWQIYHDKFELVFEYLWNSPDCSRKQIFRKIVFCVYSLESPHQGRITYQGDSNENTQHTIIV